MLFSWLRRMCSFRPSPTLYSCNGGGFVPRPSLHSLHEGELVLPKDTVALLERMSDQLPPKVRKRLGVIKRRRPTKISERELARVIKTMQSNKKTLLKPKPARKSAKRSPQVKCPQQKS